MYSGTIGRVLRYQIFKYHTILFFDKIGDAVGERGEREREEREKEREGERVEMGRALE